MSTLVAPPSRARQPRSKLRSSDVAWLAAVGFRSRTARSVLSALGIALGIATMVAVLGISSSSRAQLIAEIDALGTNLLTVTPGQFSGASTTLPAAAPAMVTRIGPVLSTAAIGQVNASVYRNRFIPSVDTGAISVYAAGTNLIDTVQGALARGRFLNAATSHFPAVVLGAQAATALGIDRADGTESVWLGAQTFAVVGILDPVALAPELDRTALIGVPIATRLFTTYPAPVEIYVRTDPASVDAVEAVLPATVDPGAPQDVAVANPADALVARADASAAFQGLFLALGGVALLVGAVGIANVMVIAVLERRGEIGLRRALGATRRHIAAQFVAEAVLLALCGGAAGALAGGFATTIYAGVRHWSAVVPITTLASAVALALAVGSLAGVYPAIRATRLSPTEALRTA